MAKRKKPRKNPRTPPPIDLASFAGEHLSHEIRMFVDARGELGRARPDTFQTSAMVELCAFHLRNLIDFFYLQGPQPDDVIAADYVPGWESQRPSISDPLNKARARANKEIAHLTTKRISGAPPVKAWDFGALSKEMKAVIAAFVRLVDPKKVSPQVISQLQKI